MNVRNAISLSAKGTAPEIFRDPLSMTSFSYETRFVIGVFLGKQLVGGFRNMTVAVKKFHINVVVYVVFRRYEYHNTQVDTSILCRLFYSPTPLYS